MGLAEFVAAPIHVRTTLFMNPLMAAQNGMRTAAGFMSNRMGKVRCMAFSARPSSPGRYGLECDRQGGRARGTSVPVPRIATRLLLNHLITDELPGAGKQDARLSNSDPITGQAAWYDVRVRVYPAEHDADHTLPQFAPMNALPGETGMCRASCRPTSRDAASSQRACVIP